MTPVPDYSRYDLEQLYEVLRHIDRERFPERLALIETEIEEKGGDPHRAPSPVFFVRRWEVTPTLRAVRWIVGLEYGLAIFALFYSLVSTPVTEIFIGCVAGCTAILMYSLFCGIGVFAMLKALDLVGNRAEVETGWLSALGLAPFSAILYIYASLAVIERLKPEPYASLFFIVPAGFYMPFVLLTFWLKYKYRDDEF